MEKAIGNLALFYADVSEIHVKDGWNPRWDLGNLQELSDSLLAQGIVNPLRVKESESGDFELVDGHRRFAAIQIANKEYKKIQKVPVLIENSQRTDTESIFTSIVANQGKPLTPIEEAYALKRIYDDGATLEAIGKLIGKSIAYVSDRLVLLMASDDIKEAILNGKLTVTSAIGIVRKNKNDKNAQSDDFKSFKNGKKAGRISHVAKAKALESSIVTYLKASFGDDWITVGREKADEHQMLLFKALES